MANPSLRLPENVPGPYYVTSECIDCGLCQEVAPAIFRRHDETGFSIVFHQPETETEHTDAREGLGRVSGGCDRLRRTPAVNARFLDRMWTDTSEFRNPHYHQITDTPETLDYSFLRKVTQALLAAVL